MPAYLHLILDTTGPQGVAGQIEHGAATTGARAVQLQATTTDPDTTGYQIKVWGDVDPAVSPDIQPLEANSNWINLTTDVAVTLSLGDAVKNLHFRLRDDVWNQSAQADAAIALDLGIPVVTATAIDVPKVSKVLGKRTAHFSFSPNRDVTTYEVRVVPDVNSPETAGTLIPTNNGSQNTSGGNLAQGQVVNVTIDGRDLELASAGDGDKIIKVFAEDPEGRWSA